MLQWSRNGFYVGLVAATVVAVFLFWLWRPHHQVQRHTENLLRALERKDWTGLENFIATEYQDQWHNDRALLLERTQETFRYVRNVRFTAQHPAIRIRGERAHWEASITVDGDVGEVTAIIRERVNSLTTPFDLEWKHNSAKPWDWKLIHVSNPTLVIPEFGE